MKKITSFTVDHTSLEPGIYVSRVDGDIVTYDLRMRKPNTDSLLSNSAMHSFEHMLATYMRNGAIGDKIIYVGPMGCQTGFYLLIRNADNNQVISVIKKLCSFSFIGTTTKLVVDFCAVICDLIYLSFGMFNEAL